MADIRLTIKIHNRKIDNSIIIKDEYCSEWDELPRKQQIDVLRAVKEWYDGHERFLNEK